jgi:hypothetical protein
MQSREEHAMPCGGEQGRTQKGDIHISRSRRDGVGIVVTSGP